ncbi:MAG: helix-turn-helix transcriptional regulator [Saprospiraceae bacterium]
MNDLVASKIKDFRKGKGFTSEYVADKLGVSKGSYSNLEKRLFNKVCLSIFEMNKEEKEKLEADAALYERIKQRLYSKESCLETGVRLVSCYKTWSSKCWSGEVDHHIADELNM